VTLIHPDILAEARGLSVGAAGFAFLVGMLLWGLGWRWHRFWIVFGVTLAAGLIGMNAGRVGGGQVLAVGILLAVTAGLMALEMARVLAFVAGGIAAWITVQSVLPAAREMWAVFLCGGLLGLLLYRLWTMLLTSSAGALLSIYAATILCDILFQIDAVSFARKNTAVLNVSVLIMALSGIVIQHLISRFDQAQQDAESAETEAKAIKRRKVFEEIDESEIAAPWWKWNSGRAA
jgi:hypothetical protein